MQWLLKHKQWLVLIALYIILLAGGWYAGHWLTDFGVADARPQTEPMVFGMIMTAAGLFVLTSATPFVPGAEIGFGLLLVFGASLAPLVYACMVLALIIAYCAGRFVPAYALAKIFANVGFTRAHDLVLKTAQLDADARLDLLTTNAPHHLVPVLLRFRYPALVVLLNLPGNSILGGAGGIAFSAGMSGIYHLPAYLLSVMIAAAPVPLIFLLMHNGYNF